MYEDVVVAEDTAVDGTIIPVEVDAPESNDEVEFIMEEVLDVVGLPLEDKWPFDSIPFPILDDVGDIDPQSLPLLLPGP